MKPKRRTSKGAAKTPGATQPPRPLIFIRSWKPVEPAVRAKIFDEWPADNDYFRAVWDQLSDDFEATLLDLLFQPGDIDAINRKLGKLQAILEQRGTILAAKGQKLMPG